ncbi:MULTISPECIES: lysine transporter LysE [unclassified Streptomyces]|uniref:lysine transporter LysE n=1 Tax=unclassified Streptomyces TaxID=2593676 RepID=UPI0035DFDDD3
MAGKVVEFLKEAVVETVGELLLQLLACALLVGLVALALWGWSVSPVLTGAGGGLFALFTGYGLWELFRGSERHRKGRLASAAVVTATVVLVFAYYASNCYC